MEQNVFPIALSVVAIMAAMGAARLRAGLRAARLRATRAETLAAARGRSLALAAQELRGIAACMAGYRVTPAAPPGEHPHAHRVGETAGKPLEGPEQQMLRLADNLAEVADAPDSRTIREAPARLGAIVDAAITTVSSQIRPGLRHWHVDTSLQALTVKADGRALEGALAALLRRAASHSRDGDVIGLRWVIASEMMAIVVEDEGDGLAATDIVPDSTAPAVGTRGLDLGLSLARALAAAHGGDIRLETAPGIGARAWLTLPRARLLEAA